MVELDNLDGDGEVSQRKVFVGGLDSSLTKKDLKGYYSQFGALEECILMRDPTTKIGWGFGFVTFVTRKELANCLNKRPHVIDGKPVDCKRFVPRHAFNKKESNQNGSTGQTSERFYIGGVGDEEQITEDHLREYFGEFGVVEKVEFVTADDTGKRRGFGFVTFDGRDPVDGEALQKTHEIRGQSCEMKRAEARPDKQPKRNRKSGGAQKRQGGDMARTGGQKRSKARDEMQEEATEAY